jgi:hypothetical protein
LVITDRSPSTLIEVVYGLPINPSGLSGCPAIALGVEIAVNRNGMQQATRKSEQSRLINFNRAKSSRCADGNGESVG